MLLMFTLAVDIRHVHCSATWTSSPASLSLGNGLASTFQAQLDLPGQPLSGGCQYDLALDGQLQSTVFVPLQVKSEQHTYLALGQKR